MFAAPFEAQAVAALRPAIRAIASRAVDELKAAAAKAGEGGGAGGKFAVDLRANFSLPVAYRTIYEILGVPPEVLGGKTRGPGGGEGGTRRGDIGPWQHNQHLERRTPPLFSVHN